jgi:hypothetical protein
MDGDNTLFTQNDTGEYVPYTPPTFQEAMPENLRDNELFKEIADPGQLAEKYVELHASQPQRPENPESYAVEIPEGFPMVEADLNEFKKNAYELGLTGEQFKGVMGRYIERELKLTEQYRNDIKKHREESMDALKMEFGDQHEDKVNRAAGVIKALGEKMGEGKAEEFNKWLDDTKFGDDPMVIRLFAAAAELISEDLLHTGGSGDGDETRPTTPDGKPRLKFPSMGDE